MKKKKTYRFFYILYYTLIRIVPQTLIIVLLTYKKIAKFKKYELTKTRAK